MKFCNTNFVICFICAVFLTSCKNDGISLQFNEAYQAANVQVDLHEIDIVLIIPNAGCQGCISTLEQFVLNRNGQLQRLLIVFTNYSSTKALRVRFSSKILDGPNVYLDSANLFGQGKLSSMYPVILYLEEGSVKKAEYVSPENPTAVANLEYALSQKGMK